MGARGTYIDVVLNKTCSTSAFVDSGCLCLATVSPRTATRAHATILPICPRPIAQVVNDQNPPVIDQVAVFDLGLGGLDEKLYAYIVPGQTEDLILGQGWIDRQKTFAKMAKSTEKLTKTTLSNSSIDSKTSSSSASNKIDKKPTARDETRRTTRLGLSFAQMASQEPRSDDDELLRSPSQHAPVTSSMKVDAGVEDAPVVEIPSTPDSRDSDATTPTPNALDGNLFVFSQAQRDENDTNNTNNTNNNNNDQVAVVQWYSTWQGFSVSYREVVGSIPTSDANFLRAVNLDWGTWG
ncbi:uncharacterized protein BROUX77_000068 [Berkeleyomyces rouxiae]|uniref:uncharacterized protein n=1 Tax=Berkeleyomyces rouxiae TaxID=2035830 RepID=UPI003B77D3B4